VAYQAYPPQIAMPAVAASRFVDPHDDKADWSRRLKTSPVRVQWDPERSLQLQARPYRSLQLAPDRVLTPLGLRRAA
jgi:Domain of unknown function (DUF4291)